MKLITPFTALLVAVVLLARPLRGDAQTTGQIGDYSSCSEPLSWGVGSIDDGFAITKSALKQLMQQVSAGWSSAAGREVLQLRDSAEVMVHLYYSAYQRKTQSRLQLQQQISAARLRHNALNTEYEALYRHHERSLAAYDSLRHLYVALVDEVNRRRVLRGRSVAIQQDEKQLIEQKRAQASTLRSRLDDRSERLNNEQLRLVGLSAKADSTARATNDMIYAYSAVYEPNEQFNQGIYNNSFRNKTITIYEFQSQAALRLVLAHEAGHALGLTHGRNPRSVMYPKLGQQPQPSLQFSAEDRQRIRRLCRE